MSKDLYRCGNSFFIKKNEWESWCNRQDSPIPGQCECGKPPKKPKPEKVEKQAARQTKRDPLRRRK